jgi:plastocyanin
MHKSLRVASFVVVVLLIALPVVALAAPPSSATVAFGSPDHGSGCNFPCVDDASFHSVDQVVPGAVAISAGGTVTFDVEGFHQVAIYAAGTTVKDVEPDPLAFPFVNDPDGRIFLGGPTADASFTFAEPGKYLVICNIAPHFEEAQMWAWIQVK